MELVKGVAVEDLTADRIRRDALLWNSPSSRLIGSARDPRMAVFLTPKSIAALVFCQTVVALRPRVRPSCRLRLNPLIYRR
jgi:hypothetical protein